MTDIAVDRLDPSLIMQLGEGFMASKTLLSAIELDLFTHLGSNALTASEIKDRLGLHERESRFPRQPGCVGNAGPGRRGAGGSVPQHRRDGGVS